MLSQSQLQIINELRSEQYNLSYEDFRRTWLLFDPCEGGSTDVENVENCIRELLSNVQVESFSPYKEVLAEILRGNSQASVINVLDIATLLPTSADMFIKYYDADSDSETSSVDFLRIWREHDLDANGALDKIETSELVSKIVRGIKEKYEESYGLKQRKFEVNPALLNNFVHDSDVLERGIALEVCRLYPTITAHHDKTVNPHAKTMMSEIKLFIIGDADKNGLIELRELAAILNVEKNFLDICPKKLQQKQLNEIFAHYDKDGSGSVEGPEFLAFVRDVIRIDDKPLSRLTRKESDVDAEELELAGSMIMGFVDQDNDGKLDKQEMGVVMQKKPPKLIKNQTAFIRLQRSFDQEENQ